MGSSTAVAVTRIATEPRHTADVKGLGVVIASALAIAGPPVKLQIHTTFRPFQGVSPDDADGH
jgi:hypothetical protein